MNRTLFRTCIAALALLVAGAAMPARAGGTARRPNVLVVLTDDQGFGDFSCHGNPVLNTPNLDQWHARSVRFVNFHAAPMCTPSRGQVMSGLDAVRNGATSVTGGRAFLRAGVLTLPAFLRRMGYRTGLFGKWHLGDNYPHRPMDRGFEAQDADGMNLAGAFYAYVRRPDVNKGPGTAP